MAWYSPMVSCSGAGSSSAFSGSGAGAGLLAAGSSTGAGSFWAALSQITGLPNAMHADSATAQTAINGAA